jgi:iron(III) transport system substrate-binding protein
MSKLARFTLLMVLVLAGVAAAGCGDDDDGSEVAVDVSQPVKAPPDVTKQLKELEPAARKENGPIHYYFILGEEANRDLFDTFSERYPFVEFEVSGGDPLQLLEKVVSENKAGRPVADILQGGPLEDQVLNTNNDLGMPFEPAGEALADERVRVEGNVVVSDYFTFHTVYNTNEVSEDEAPTSLEDLTKPEWRGRFGIDLEQIDWFAGELGYYGEKEGLTLMRRLAANKPVIFAGAEGYEQVAAGALPAAINLFSAAVVPYLEEGAPMALANLDHTIAQPDMYFGIKSSDVPNKVKLFLAWLFTEEAQQILSQNSFKNPVVKGVKPPPHLEAVCEDPCELFVETSEVFGDFDQRVEQFRSVFTR